MSNHTASSRHRHKGRVFGLLLIVIIGFSIFQYVRPLPRISVTTLAIPKLNSQNISINWPSSGQAAIGAEGFGVLASNKDSIPVPTASLAKIITALCVLQKYPLAIGQSGPELTMTATDVQIYNNYVAEDGSVAQVQTGEQLSEYQMLEGMLLPSANNMADSLAIWAFGSLNAYATYANRFLAYNGLTSTHVGSDASGFDPSTTSTAGDLVKLGELAVQQPSLMNIASLPQANLPVAGTVYNYNSVLGRDGINGLKTGNNNQDLGAFIFTAKILVGSNFITVVGALMDQPSLSKAMLSSVPLVGSLQSGFEQKTIFSSGQTLAYYKVPWENRAVNAIAQHNAASVLWKADPSQPTISLKKVQVPSVAGSDIGSIITYPKTPSTPIVLSHNISTPSWWWRLTRH